MARADMNRVLAWSSEALISNGRMMSVASTRLAGTIAGFTNQADALGHFWQSAAADAATQAATSLGTDITGLARSWQAAGEAASAAGERLADIQNRIRVQLRILDMCGGFKVDGSGNFTLMPGVQNPSPDPAVFKAQLAEHQEAVHKAQLAANAIQELLHEADELDSRLATQMKSALGRHVTPRSYVMEYYNYTTGHIDPAVQAAIDLTATVVSADGVTDTNLQNQLFDSLSKLSPDQLRLYYDTLHPDSAKILNNITTTNSQLGISTPALGVLAQHSKTVLDSQTYTDAASRLNFLDAINGSAGVAQPAPQAGIEPAAPLAEQVSLHHPSPHATTAFAAASTAAAAPAAVHRAAHVSKPVPPASSTASSKSHDLATPVTHTVQAPLRSNPDVPAQPVNVGDSSKVTDRNRSVEDQPDELSTGTSSQTQSGRPQSSSTDSEKSDGPTLIDITPAA